MTNVNSFVPANWSQSYPSSAAIIRSSLPNTASWASSSSSSVIPIITSPASSSHTLSMSSAHFHQEHLWTSYEFLSNRHHFIFCNAFLAGGCHSAMPWMHCFACLRCKWCPQFWLLSRINIVWQQIWHIHTKTAAVRRGGNRHYKPMLWFETF